MKLNIIDFICLFIFLAAGWYAAALGWLIGAFVGNLVTNYIKNKEIKMYADQEFENLRNRIIKGNRKRINYPMFIDDERQPAASFPKEGVIIRSYEAFINYVTDNGLPTFISFDHDLGGDMSGKDIVNYIIARDQEFGDLPQGFTFFVHSQNPVGKKNIEDLLNSYLEFRNGQS